MCLLTLGAVVLLVAGRGDVAAGQETVGRDWMGGRWEQISGVAPDADLLLDPQLLAVDESTLYVFDYGDLALKAFSLRGDPRWTLGRAGGGPGEFRNPTDLKATPRGVWVIDPGNVRLTLVSHEGAVLETLTMGREISTAIPQPDGSLLGFGATSPFLVHLAPDGSAHDSSLIPETLVGTHPLLREAYAAAAPTGEGMLGFRWSSRRLLIAGGRVQVFDGVEPRPIPTLVQSRVQGNLVTKVDPEAREAVLSAAGWAGASYFLYGGRTEHAGRIVDAYRVVDGAYLASWLLPRKGVQLAVVGDAFALLVRYPAPAVVVWRWRVR